MNPLCMEFGDGVRGSVNPVRPLRELSSIDHEHLSGNEIRER
jgi:hypothetical protein